MDAKLAKELSKLACDARRKAAYMKYIPNDPGKWNYEQKQSAADVLEEFAYKLEVTIAQHYIHTKLANNPIMLLAISRQCREAIKREIRKTETREQYAALC